MNPAKQFFKIVRELEDECFYSGMSAPPFRYKRVDIETCTRDGHWLVTPGGDRVLWVLDPKSYCIHGRPIYTSEQLQEMRKNSETEKALFVHEEFGKTYKFVWMWNHWIEPTNTHWGVQMSEPFYEVRVTGGEDGGIRSKYKSSILDWWKRQKAAKGAA